MVTVQTLRGNKKMIEVIAQHALVTVGRDFAKKGCTCGKCDNPIFKGDERVIAVTSSDVTVYHDTCYNDMATFVADDDSQATNYNAKSTVNHKVEVVADKKLACWFYKKGFIATKYSPTHRKYVLVEELNRHRTGHLIKTLVAHFTVFVNGEEIKSFEDFDRVTR